MVTVFDVKANQLISATAQKLKTESSNAAEMACVR